MYIQKLPKAEQQREHWQTAVVTLINCAEGRDFLFHANAAMLQVLHHGKPESTPRAPAGRRRRPHQGVRQPGRARRFSSRARI